jgi:hypothetical protein
MKTLYRIFFYDVDTDKSNGLHFVNSKHLNDENFFNKSNLEKSYIEDIMSKKNAISFYHYTILNKEIYKDIKKLFFHKIIMGEITIPMFDSSFSIIKNSFCYNSTFSLYRDKIFNLKELEELHKIFSKYEKNKDYIIFEELYFKKYRFAVNLARKIEESSNYVFRMNVCDYKIWD